MPAKVAYNLTRASKNDQQKCSLQNEFLTSAAHEIQMLLFLMCKYKQIHII